MQIESTRLGMVEIGEDTVITFADGLPGLPGEQWGLIATDENSPFFWLQSLAHAEVAVPVTSPWLFFGDYEVRLSDDEAGRLGLSDAGDAYIVCVVRAAESLDDFTINLVSPLVINAGSRKGRQVINEAGGYSVRHPLFSEVELDEVQPTRSAVPVTAAGG
jgi:flagellar assembly factor FliW